MDLNIFITAVFCLADDWLREQGSPRRRGPAPDLSDSEVLTIDIVGEFLGIDAEKGLYTYFRRHYGEWFPALPPSGPPHHFHPPDGQPLGAEEETLARAPRPDRFRPRSVLDRLLPATGL